jgi:hypothetical protein
MISQYVFGDFSRFANRKMTTQPEATPRLRPHCYICGAIENLSDDHIPPKGFFPPDNRDDLITAPLCSDCHPRLTKTDEAMRVWIAAGATETSSNARWIWKNKVVDSTFKRSPKLRQYIVKKHLHEMRVETPHGVAVKSVITMPQGRAIPFARRLTKGFLYSFYPNYDYFGDSFNVVYRLPTQETVSVISKLATHLSRRFFGKDVFRIWHGLTQDSPKSGAWIFLFYDAVCFVCFHGKSGAFTQQELEDGYKEEPGLPQRL